MILHVIIIQRNINERYGLVEWRFVTWYAFCSSAPEVVMRSMWWCVYGFTSEHSRYADEGKQVISAYADIKPTASPLTGMTASTWIDYGPLPFSDVGAARFWVNIRPAAQFAFNQLYACWPKAAVITVINVLSIHRPVIWEPLIQIHLLHSGHLQSPNFAPRVLDILAVFLR